MKHILNFLSLNLNKLYDLLESHFQHLWNINNHELLLTNVKFNNNVSKLGLCWVRWIITNVSLFLKHSLEMLKFLIIGNSRTKNHSAPSNFMNWFWGVPQLLVGIGTYLISRLYMDSFVSLFFSCFLSFLEHS